MARKNKLYISEGVKEKYDQYSFDYFVDQYPIDMDDIALRYSMKFSRDDMGDGYLKMEDEGEPSWWECIGEML